MDFVLNNYAIWYIFGIFLLILEVFGTGSIALSCGMGAICTGIIIHLVGDNMPIEHWSGMCLVYALISLTSFFVIKKICTVRSIDKDINDY